MKRLLLAGAVMSAVACSSEPSAVIVRQHKVGTEGDTATPAPLHPLTVTDESAATSTTTTLAPTTTTIEPAPATTVATVRRTTTSTAARPTQLAPVVHDADFWYRLATCESGNGRGSANQFQFMGGTAEKVGYYPGASYEEQRAMAIDWASRIHPNEGTSAGWPECWWRAGGS